MVKDIGAFDFDGEMALWHYTNGAGLLGILESGSIRASQVACVNDSTETLYATRLFRDALLKVRETNSGDKEAVAFLDNVLEEIAEGPDVPGHASSQFFVACFSSLEDDINQWLKYGGLHGENGYAVGFRARGLMIDVNTVLARVSYDRTKHERMALAAAESTLAFYREGLTGARVDDPAQWAKEFFAAWDTAIYRLSPLLKDDCFSAEMEFRVVHELQAVEYPQVRFVQKDNMLARYIDLQTDAWRQTRNPSLPIVKVLIGPGRNKGITKVSVKTLLTQMGYPDVEVGVTKRPVQRP